MRKLSFIAFSMLVAASPMMAQSAGPAGAIGGYVVDAHGAAVAGAVVRYQRIVQYVHAASGLQPVPREAIATGQIQTDGGGAFAVPDLPVGDYNLCASAPSTAYLDPCVWGQALRTTVSSAVAASTTIVLQRGVFLNVRVNDPLQLLSPLVDGPLTPSKLAVGVVYANRAYRGAHNINAASMGRDYQLAIPVGTPFTLWLFSRDVTLADSNGAPIPASGSATPVVAVAGQDQTFTFTVSGRAQQ